MNFVSFDSLRAWAMVLSLAAHLAAGIVLGVLYFRSLWWSACRFTGPCSVPPGSGHGLESSRGARSWRRTAVHFAGTCARSGRAATTIALMIGRFALLGGLLTLASLEGALPLLVMALGVLIARSVVMRRVREAAA